MGVLGFFDVVREKRRHGIPLLTCGFKKNDIESFNLDSNPSISYVFNILREFSHDDILDISKEEQGELFERAKKANIFKKHNGMTVGTDNYIFRPRSGNFSSPNILSVLLNASSEHIASGINQNSREYEELKNSLSSVIHNDDIDGVDFLTKLGILKTTRFTHKIKYGPSYKRFRNLSGKHS